MGEQFALGRSFKIGAIVKLSLVVCTYQRPVPLATLLDSVVKQTKVPDEIIIVDGSLDTATQEALKEKSYPNLKYSLVTPEHRGLTKQRNYGIDRVAADMDIVCFLDDDIVLELGYFEILTQTYNDYPDALGVGGYIINEVKWEKVAEDFKPKNNEFSHDGYVRKDGSRFVLRKKLGLDANTPPGFPPDFSHGRSVSFLPASGKVYPVAQFMGGVASYPLRTLKEQRFSEYFEGYGLYEDADYTLRLSNKGNLYVNTAAQLYHYHDPDGRPNKFSYGKMVIRNGWYVWRVKYPKPSLKARLKWNLTSGLLTIVRLSNALTSNSHKRKEAFTESMGRIAGWFSLLFNKPLIQDT